eukprot:NODE_264_length_12431_cov_0.389556.p7 type:complete len:101 gc:universal NODE_264_length_12431_cov_0.389556:411-109(-)
MHSSTLWNWSKHGRIRCISTPGKRSTINKLVNHLLTIRMSLSYHMCNNRDHMTARNLYKYIHPYSIPPQGSASVTNHCNGVFSTASFSVGILDFLGNQDF